ncbi:MAG: T9SS type A sorting domain-containing protein [bacterium]
MKKLYSFLVLSLLMLFNAIAEDKDNNNLPQPLGEIGWAMVYYISPIPSRQDSGYFNDIKLYISSSEEKDVTVKVEGKDIEIKKKTIPNDFIEFSIPVSIGMVYLKNDEDKPITDTIFSKSAIRVVSSIPFKCYCTIGGSKSMAGFLALPMQQLGKNYILSSHTDYSNNVTEFFPGEATITAVSDKTKVKIIKNISDSPDTTTYILNDKDVLLLSTKGYADDLTGTVIEASKPVAVVSGNYCAYIPETSEHCDMIAEFEMPTNMWGTEYYVPFFFNHKSNPIIKIFAKEDSTKIFRDNEYIGTIMTGGGKEGSGFFQMLSDTGASRPVIISGDKPINVVLYNPGPDEETTVSYPAQLSLSPIEQYTREVSFKIDGSQLSPDDYLLLIYEAAETGEIPDDMEFAQVLGGNYEWMKLKELTPKPGTAYNNFNGKNYFFKQIPMPGQGVYRVRNNEPFAAYIYNNEKFTTQLFQATYVYSDNTIVDTLPPIPEWEMDCNGDVSGVLQDTGDSYNMSNPSTIYMHSDISYNYRLIVDEFLPCEDSIVTWRLEIIDCSEDANAFLTFADCAGNDTTFSIHYTAPNLEFSSLPVEFANCKMDTVYEKIIWLKNKSDSLEIWIEKIEFLNNGLGFTVLDTNYSQLVVPFKLKMLDSIPLLLQFRTSSEGFFIDTLKVNDTCCYYKQIPVIGYTEGTGINDNISHDKVSIIPNPASEQVTIICDKQISDLKIFDILGCDKGCPVSVGEGRSIVNTSELTEGIYFVKIAICNKNIIRKFIIRR